MRKIITSAVLVLCSLAALAANVELKYTGPDGQGDLVWWNPATGMTNMILRQNGTTEFYTVTIHTAAVGNGVTNGNADALVGNLPIATLTNALKTSGSTYTNAQAGWTNTFSQYGILLSHNP